MRRFKNLNDPKLIKCIIEGGVVVIPTDTVYGIVARATDHHAVERVYKLRKRHPQKPCIMLIAGLWQVADRKLWEPIHYRLAEKYWPGAMSLVVSASDQIAHYLHRGTCTLAYRMPDKYDLRELLASTGPLIAPSANHEGMPASVTIKQAKEYFGDKVDGYVDGGDLSLAQASTVVTVKNGEPIILRQGDLKIGDTTEQKNA